MIQRIFVELIGHHGRPVSVDVLSIRSVHAGSDPRSETSLVYDDGREHRLAMDYDTVMQRLQDVVDARGMIHIVRLPNGD